MLEVKNLTKSYGKTKVLNNINLKVEKGEVLLIIGPSGAGKSTFLKCINMIEKYDKGKVILDGTTIDNSNINLMRQKIGMVFQQFNLFPHLTVLENIILAPVKLKLMTKKEATTKALEYLKNIDLLDKKDCYPDNLSGGQQQRVAIIRTIIMSPEVILFDEPTSSLDPEMTRDVVSLISKIKEKKVTMIIVSHEMAFVREVAERIIFIENGRVEEDSKIEDINKTKKIQSFLSTT